MEFLTHPLHYDVSHHSSQFDSILMEPSTTAPPVQAPKPNTSRVVDFDSINFSVTSDASEVDSVVFGDNVKSGFIGNFPVSPKGLPTLSGHFEATSTLNIPPKGKDYVGRVYEQASVVGGNFMSNVNSTLPQSKMKNLVSSKAHQFKKNSSENCILDEHGEYKPGFRRQYEMNTNFSSSHQNAHTANGKIKGIETCDSGATGIDLLNQSDSVTLLPKQLQFHESNATKDSYINRDSVSNSKYVSENDLTSMHQMQKKVGIHNGLDQKEDKSLHSNYHQQSRATNFIDSGVSLNNDLNSNILNAKENVSNDILSMIKEQNEKIKQLQDQLLAMQQEKNSASVSNQAAEVQKLEDKRFDKINESLNSIVQYIADHNNTMSSLKDQISILVKRTDELESKSRGNHSLPIDLSRSGAEANGAQSKSNSENNVMCCNETRVKTTSSSTMTSVTLDGNERVLLHKTTVVTENSKDLLFQHSKNKNSTEGSPLNKCQNRSGQVASNNCNCIKPKKKSKQMENCHRICENVAPIGDVHSPVTPTLKLRKSNSRKSSPLADSNRANGDVNIKQSPGEGILPNFERIVRNIDNLVLKNDDEVSVVKHCSSCCCSEPSNSPSTGAIPSKRKSRRQKNSDVPAYSSTSEDSDFASPNCKWIENEACENIWYDSTKKKYGIPPSLLSVDTQQYLEKHRLCDNTGKWTSRAPHFKQLR